MVDFGNIKLEIEKIAKRHNLLLVLLYGSQVKGDVHKESDIDIAVLGIKPVSTDDLIALSNELRKYLMSMKSMLNPCIRLTHYSVIR